VTTGAGVVVVQAEDLVVQQQAPVVGVPGIDQAAMPRFERRIDSIGETGRTEDISRCRAGRNRRSRDCEVLYPDHLRTSIAPPPLERRPKWPSEPARAGFPGSSSFGEPETVLNGR
jgi:hypothetical protein